MASALALALVLAALVQRWRCAAGPAAAAEALALLGALALGLLGLLAALLAVFGWFSGPSFAITALALVALIWPWGQRPIPAPPGPRRGLAAPLALAGLLALAAALRWPPLPAELAGRDHGTYALRAAHTLRTGRVSHVDPVLAAAGAELGRRPGPGDIQALFPIDGDPARAGRYEGAYRPGFYLASRERGDVTPQFLHLHPSLLALFGLAFGPGALGLVAPLCGLLSILALWALAARLWPRGPWRWLAAGLLALSPIAVWVHRVPLSEPITGLLLLAAALAAARGWREGRDPGLLCALLLGLAGLTRGNLWLAAPALLALLWLRPGSDPRRMAAPTLLFGLLLASFALHLATCFPYLYDELRRQLGPAALLGPLGALALGALVLAGYLLLDRALRPLRGRLRRAPSVLAALALAALLAYLALRAPGPPYSRLDAALPLLGAPLLLAGALGLVALARARLPADAGAAWLGATATLPLTALALYAQRNLPDLGLYYYGRYLVPELLPALCLLATGSIVQVHQALSRAPHARRPAPWIALGLALALLGDQAAAYLRAPVTRLEEFAGAGRLVRDLAAEIPDRAVVLAGGEGWHAPHTWNQLGGALALAHGRTLLPYRGREAAYASLHELLIAGPAARGEPAPPVFLLLGEAARPLPGDPPTALVDDLLPPPFAARPVAFAELYADRLTPLVDRIPDRVTRTDLRVALLEVQVDPARLGDARVWRLAGGEAHGPGPLSMSGYTLREDLVCLRPDAPLTLALPAGGPGSLVLVAHPGSDPHTWRVHLGGAPLALDAPGGPPRPRDTLGPFPFARAAALEVWGAPGARPGRVCPHGGLAELRLLGPDRGPDPAAQPRWIRTYTPPHDLGHGVAPARWTSGRALSRQRPGLVPALEPEGPALRLPAGATLTFPLEHVPGGGSAPLQLVLGVRAAHLSPAGRVQVWSEDQLLFEVDPPDELAGAWHAPPRPWRPPGPTARLRVTLVDPDPAASIGVRDLALALVPPA